MILSLRWELRRRRLNMSVYVCASKRECKRKSHCMSVCVYVCLKVMLTKRHSCMQLNYKTAFLQLCKDIYIMHVYVKMFEGVFECMHECGCLSQRARAFQRQYISKGIHSLSLSVRTSVLPSVRPSFKSYVYSLCQSVTNHSFCHTFIHLTIHPSCQTCNQPNIYPLNPYHYYHTLSLTHTYTHTYT